MPDNHEKESTKEKNTFEQPAGNTLTHSYVPPANVKENFTWCGKQSLTLFGKQFFTLFGKDNFTLSGKEFFHLLWVAVRQLSGKHIRVLQPVGLTAE